MPHIQAPQLEDKVASAPAQLRPLQLRTPQLRAPHLLLVCLCHIDLALPRALALQDAGTLAPLRLCLQLHGLHDATGRQNVLDLIPAGMANRSWTPAHTWAFSGIRLHAIRVHMPVRRLLAAGARIRLERDQACQADEVGLESVKG